MPSLPREVPAGPAAVPDPGDGSPGAAAWGAVFRLASRATGERLIHAKGLALTGHVAISGGRSLGLPLLDEPGRYEAVLRLSRAVGLPDAVPDFLGLAVRLLDAGGPGRHQDLVLDTGSRPPVLRSLPLARRDILGSTYSSLLPYDVAGRRILVGAQPVGGPRVLSLARLPEVLPVRFRLVVATRTGPWQQVGTVVADAVLPAPEGRRVRFSPYTVGGGLVPAGLLNGWRRDAYAASHVGPDA